MTSLLTTSNLLAWSFQAAVVIGAALTAIRLVRLDVPAVRYAALRLVLAVCLLLPFVQRGADTTAGRGGVVTSETMIRAGDDAPAGVATLQGSLLDWLSSPWSPLVAIALLTGVLVRLLWIGAGVARLRRLRRAGEVAPAGGDIEDLQSLLGTRADVRYVPGLGQPVTFGFRKPIVLLPSSLLARPPAIQRAVVAHELWHVRRKDWIWTVAEEALRALFWFHPAMWMLVSRIQAAREEVVDELSILATGSRRSYVDALLAYADEAPLFAATAFARRRHLVHRMVLISKEAVMSARRVVACCALLTAAVMSSGWYAVEAFPLVQSATDPNALFAPPGPVELRARPITPENPIPRRTFHVPPAYPPEAVMEGVRGSVSVRAVVDEAGTVAETRVEGLSVTASNRFSLSLNNMSRESLDRAMTSALRGAPGEPAVSASVLRPFILSVAAAAARAVTAWRYAPPFEGPVAFTVSVPFGSPAVDSPPPPDRDFRWAAAQGALRVGGNIKPPTKIHNVNPAYPPDALAAKVQGVVILETRIEPDGTVGDVRVLRSIPMLDGAAVEAVRQWQFTPTLLNGKPVPVIMTCTVNFTLQ